MKDINLKVIVPLHEYNKDINKLLSEAVASVPENISVVVSCKNGIGDKVNKLFTDKKNVVVDEADKGAKTDFCSLVNRAVGGTEWFSILEYDDTYTKIWFDNFAKYKEFNSDVSVFVPLEDLYKAETKEFIGFGNEATLASSFSNELGFIDHDCLQNFFDFYLTGSIFNTDDWNEIGGLKPSIKLSFWYEWLLRATYKGKKIYTIPKIGYNHTLGRKGSLLEQYKESVSDDEAKWLINLAKKEFYFKDERDATKYIYDANKTSDDEE